MEKYEMNNGRLGLSSTETLYSHVQKVYLKYRTGEDNSKMLRLTMEIKSELTLSAGKVFIFRSHQLLAVFTLITFKKVVLGSMFTNNR